MDNLNNNQTPFAPNAYPAPGVPAAPNNTNPANVAPPNTAPAPLNNNPQIPTQGEKSNSMLIIIILSALLLIACGVIVWLAISGQPATNTANTGSPEVANQDSEAFEDVSDESYIAELISSLHEGYNTLYGDLPDAAKYLYDISDSISTEELSSDYVMKVATYKVAANNLKNGKMPGLNKDDSLGVPAEEFEAAARDIFGQDIELKPKTVSSCSFGTFSYDGSKDIFTWNLTGCGATLNPFYISEIASANQYADHLEVVEKVAYLVISEEWKNGDEDDEGENLAYDIFSADGKQKIASNFLMEDYPSYDDYREGVKAEYLDDFSVYKYTFVPNSDGGWAFSKIERL